MPWQIRLHWLVAILLVITCVTIELRGFAEPGSAPWYVLVVTHFSCGVTVFALMIARLFLRWRHPSPAIAPKPPKWQTGLAHLTHTLIYLLLLTLPVLGVYSRYLGAKSGIYSACRCRSPTWPIGRRRGRLSAGTKRWRHSATG